MSTYSFVLPLNEKYIILSTPYNVMFSLQQKQSMSNAHMGQIVDFYRSNPQYYYTKHPQFKNTKKKEFDLMNFAASIGLSGII